MGIVFALLSWGSAVFAACLIAAYFYFSRNFNHWKRKGVAYIKPRPFVGNLGDVVLLKKNIGLLTKQIYDDYKTCPYIGIYAFDEPVLQVHDLDLIKRILVTDFKFFCDRSLSANERHDPIGARTLLCLKGDRWRRARTAVTPSFNSGKVKRMYGVMLECAGGFGEILCQKSSSGDSIDLFECATRYATDCIAACALGIRSDALKDPDAEFRKKLRLVFDFSAFESFKYALSFLAPALLDILNLQLMKPEVDNFMRSTVSNEIKQRENSSITRGDLLDSLIEIKNNGRISDDDQRSPLGGRDNEGMEILDVVAHSFNFLVAGFETPGKITSFLLYRLALDSGIQDRLRNEIREALQGRAALSYEEIQSLKYLDMVLKETLRLYPSLPYIGRVVTEDYTLPGTNIVLDKGSRIIIPMYGIHMDAELFPLPKSFDPERFSDQNKNNFIQSAYMPFGFGPRNCIGSLFATTEIKAAIVRVLKEYTVYPCADTPKEIQFNTRSFLLTPKHKIRLILKRN